jgi:uncharacterized protein (DUF1800 family)
MGLLALPASAETGSISVGGTLFSSTACAKEGRVCSFTGTHQVAYGASGKFAVLSLTGPAKCNNAVFGDPIVGVYKACHLALQSPAPSQGAQVCFFEHVNYGGAKFCVGVGKANVSAAWNDRVSSVRVPAGLRVELRQHYNAGGRKLVLTGHTASLVPLAFNDLLSSYAVSLADATTPTPKPKPAPKPKPTPPSPSPRPCTGQTLGWTVAGNACSAASTSVTSGQSVSLVDTVAPTTGQSAFRCLDGNWGSPLNPVCTTAATVPVTDPAMGSTARANAARLLVQATYGPTLSAINEAAESGVNNWITQQFSTASMDTHWEYAIVRKGPPGCTVCDSQYVNAVMESFWLQAVRGPDQLRQRTVLALSEIFVISDLNSSISGNTQAHASYLDMLSRNAFGNFRQLLEQVSTHPSMGAYLSHFQNEKEDPATGRIPDENYAREVMQLFTIGLWELNPDGTRRRDGSGNFIPTYSQADVSGLARVFTGWSWNGPDKSYGRWKGWTDGQNWREQMQNYPQFHSTGEKRFLGVTVPPNTSGEQSLRIALDTMFNHPNVGPFIGRQLIQRFVTSNPSPAFVGRVAAAFNNNGQGVRGDMRAVLRTVLLDFEARDPNTSNQANWGKLREPMVRFGAWMRAFDARAANGYYRIWNLEDNVSSLGQNPLRAPSVFNWFRPDYAPPGQVLSQGLVAPEFQITHDTTVTGYANFVAHTVERGHGYNDGAIRGNYAAELPLSSNPAALMDRLNLLLTAGRMTPATRQTIINAINEVPVSEAARRVHIAIALTMISPEFIVQK